MSIEFSEGQGPPADVLAETEWIFRATAEDLARSMQRVRAGEFGEVRAAVKTMQDLRAAFQQVQEERARVEKLRKHATGVVAGHELDLDAARAEIGRRLACLRDAGGH
jgi:hypothetical protein